MASQQTPPTTSSTTTAAIAAAAPAATNSTSTSTKRPKDVSQAKAHFRRRSIDAAHEVSTIDWHLASSSSTNNLTPLAATGGRTNRTYASAISSSSSRLSSTGAAILNSSSSIRNRHRRVSILHTSASLTEDAVLFDDENNVTTDTYDNTIEDGNDTVKYSNKTLDDDSAFDCRVQKRTESLNGQEIEQTPDLQEAPNDIDFKYGATTKSSSSEPSGDDNKQKTSSTSRNYWTIRRSYFLSTYYNRHMQTLVSLALFSYLGEFLRFLSEEFFGLACQKPDTVSWNDNDWAPCTTSPGTTDSTGGAFFNDLPANVIGCLIMGLLVTGDGESLAINIPIAILPRNSPFQRWTITHVGMRTGFCGALTTLASWNTQMVVMICGGSATVIGSSQWMSAVWGYVVGLFVALQSFLLGKSIAYASSRRWNPELALEADIIHDKKEIGVVVNRELPDFERRFLHDILLESLIRENQHSQTIPTEISEQQQTSDLQSYGKDVYESHFDNHIHHLLAWKEQTKHHRHTGSPYAHELHDIEIAFLVNHEEPRQELLEMARDAGWDIEHLHKWTVAMEEASLRGVDNDVDKRDEHNDKDDDDNTKLEHPPYASDTSIFEILTTAFICLLFTSLCIWGAVNYSGTDPVSRNYRNQYLSALLSPFGTFLRWYLSRFNGTIQSRKWEWLPIGTLLANLIAVVVSALMQGIIHVTDPEEYLAAGFMEAIKVGFAGSLSTVSTFAAETVGLLKALPRYFWGYYYCFGTLLLAFLIGTISYVWSID